MVGGGGSENNPLKPPIFGCKPATHFCETYDKLNKLEFFSKYLYKIIHKSLFFLKVLGGRGGGLSKFFNM